MDHINSCANMMNVEKEKAKAYISYYRTPTGEAGNASVKERSSNNQRTR